MIDAAVGAAGSADGALHPDQVSDLIDEISSLNLKRHRSYFHRGFFGALFTDAQPDLGHAEMNAERRAWQLCGFLAGCARRTRWPAMVQAMREHLDTVKQLGSGRLEASGLAAPLIFERALREHGLPAAAGFIEPEAIHAAGATFAETILKEGIARLRAGHAEEAAPALELLDRAIRRDQDEVIPPEVRRELTRRIGQLQLRRGDFRRAAAVFEELLGSDLPEWMRRRTQADLGLARAKCRSLADVRLAADNGSRELAAKRLEAGEKEFTEAARAEFRTGGRGDYCLGVLLLARGKPTDARPYFERAIAEMSAEPAVHQVGGVLPRARLYQAIAALQSATLSGAEAEIAEGGLRAAMEEIPDDLKRVLKEVLFALAAADPERAARFGADAFAKLGDAVLAAAEEAELLPHLPALRDALLDRARTEGRQAGTRFDEARKVLAASRETNDHDRAREAFDILEHLAAKTGAERRKLLHLVGDVEAWESVWEPFELRAALVPLLLAEGRAPDAGTILVQTARELAARGDDASLDLARDAIEQAEMWSVEAPPDLKRALKPRTAPPAQARKPFGRVLFIGGNETQERYDEDLKAMAKARWPDVHLELIYPGWSSNWGRDVGTIETRIQNAGAVVLMKYVRTLLGHRIRALCSQNGKPWVPCTGHGRDWITRSIERAVGMLPSKA